MCGIVGYVGRQKATAIILEGLKRLEYPGYDSAGICVLQGRKLEVTKKAGRVERLAKEPSLRHFNGTTGIGHTRRAMHGSRHRPERPSYLSSDSKFGGVG